jgi:hypothetical protein
MTERPDHNLCLIDNKMNNNKTNKIKEILNQWNPLGERANQIPDLNNYETEANDIIFNIEMDLEFKKIKNSKNLVKKIVKEVLNEAFNLWLTDEDCEKPSELIYNVLFDK